MKQPVRKRPYKSFGIKRLFLRFFLAWFQAFAYIDILFSMGGRKL